MVTMRSLLESEKNTIIDQVSSLNKETEIIAYLERVLKKNLISYNEACQSDAVRVRASALMEVMVQDMTLVDSLADVKIYEKVSAEKKKRSVKVYFFAIAGLVSFVIGLVLNGFHQNVPWLVLLGVLSLFLFYMSGRSENKAEKKAEVEISYDGEKIYAHLLKTCMVMDQLLSEVKSEEKTSQRHQTEKEIENADQKELSLIGSLLEQAYGDKDNSVSENVISEIRYYLHARGIDMLEYSPEHADCFDILPGKEGTMRPALIKAGVVLKKGLACRKD